MRQPTEAQVTARFNNIASELTKYADTSMTKELVSSFCALAIKQSKPKSIKLNSIQLHALENSCSHLLGKTKPLDVIKRNMYRLLANWHFIMDGYTIPEWDGTAETTDCIVIGLTRATLERGKKPIYSVKMKLKTGLCAGIIISIPLSNEALYAFLTKHSGTRDFNCAAEEISGMKLRVVIKWESNGYRIKGWTCTQKQKEHNKKLAEARSDVRKCRLNRPCNTCAADITQCPLAVWLPKEEVNT